MIGGFSLKNVPIDLELPSDGDGLQFDILGNDVLKRFNVILNYSNGIIYLQPNSLAGSPYNKSFDENWIYLVVFIVLGVLLLGLIYYKRRKTFGKTKYNSG
jgi:hypothetical protein